MNARSLFLAVFLLTVSMTAGCQRVTSTQTSERTQKLSMVKEKEATKFQYSCYSPTGIILINDQSYPVKSVSDRGIDYAGGMVILKGVDGTRRWFSGTCDIRMV